MLYENTDTYESLSISVFFFFRPNVFLASILQDVDKDSFVDKVVGRARFIDQESFGEEGIGDVHG